MKNADRAKQANCWAKKSYSVKKGTLHEYDFKFSVLPFWAVAT